MIRCLAIICGLFLSCLTNAQIQGIVLDQSSQTPIADAELLELSTGISCFTDSEGKFLLETINTLSTQFIIYKEGYQVLDVILGQVKDEYIFQLEKLQVELSGVELIAQRKEIFATKKLKDIDGTSIYAGKKTEVVVLDLIKANTAANVSRQVYAQISGLNIYEGSDGGVQLNIGGRGLDPNRTSNFNTRQNGYDISADVLGYPENYYTPPSDALEEIRILRGASSLQYGTQFGGLIDFRIRKIPRFKTWDIRTKQTKGSFGFYNSFNALSYNNKNFAIDAFYNYKQGDGYRNNSVFTAHNAFIATRFFLSKKTQLDLEFSYFNYLAKQAGGLTDVQFAENSRLSTRDRNWFLVDWQLYNAKLHHDFTKDSRLELNLFALNAKRNSVGFRGNPIVLNENPILALDEQNNAGEYVNPRDLILGEFRNAALEIKLLNKFQLKQVLGTWLIGAKYYKANNTSIQGPGSIGTDANFELQTSSFPDYANQSNFILPNLNFAAFTESIFYLNNNLSITPGLRLEYIKTESEGSFQEVVYDLAGNPLSNTSFEETTSLLRRFLIAGIGIDYSFAEQHKFSINLSQNYRSVTFSDIRVTNPSFIVDENISDEKGFSLTAGISGRLQSKFSYDLSLYSILYNQRIGIILDDRANRVRTNIGDAIIAGTESLINFIPYQIIKNDKKLFQVKTFLNTAFTLSEYLNSLSNNVVGNQVEFIPLINIKTGLTLDYKNLSSSLQYSFVSKQYTDAQNSQASLSDDLRSGIVGEIPQYQILDLSLRYAWNSVSLEAGINNLLDAAYFTRRATGYPGPGIIPSDGRSFYLTAGYSFQE